MKPKTKLQHRIVELMKRLPDLTDHQKEWAIDKCFPKIAYMRKRSFLCMECGNTFPIVSKECTKPKNVTCQHCGKLLNVVKSRKRTWIDKQYYSIITTVEEMQVLRHYLVEKRCKQGQQANIQFSEVVQNWISEKGKLENVSRMTAMSIYYDLWINDSKMELRSKGVRPYKYDIYANFIYPRKKIIPTLRRNGFKGGVHGITPCWLLAYLLKYSEIETLLKAKQYSLLRKFTNSYYYSKIDKYWPAIKICIRKEYIVKDADCWCDYIDLLIHYGKDIHNAHYVCPKDLNAEHDRYVRKRQADYEEEMLELNKKLAEEYEPLYRKFIQRFTDLSISDGEILIEPLKTVSEFIYESKVMRHCIFANEYYKKENSLILSARIENKPIETIEVSLSNLKVIQCRGKFNKNTKYHNRIIELMNNNMWKIKKAV